MDTEKKVVNTQVLLVVTLIVLKIVCHSYNNDNNKKVIRIHAF